MSVRFTRILYNLRCDPSAGATADELERSVARTPPCPTHGQLDDPCIGFVGERLVAFCPACSGSAVREAWEREALTEAELVVVGWYKH